MCRRQTVNSRSNDGAWVFGNNTPTFIQTTASCSMNPPNTVLTSLAVNSQADTVDLYDPSKPQTGTITYSIQQLSVCPAGTTELNTLQCIQTATPTGFEIEPANIGNCPTQTVTIGDTFNCVFPLSGAPAGVPYLLPPQGLLAGYLNIPGDIPSYQGQSGVCTVSGATLVCNGITTGSGTAGAKPITIHQPGIQWIQNKGTVNLVAATVPPVIPVPPTTIDQPNIGLCPTQTVIIGMDYNCIFPLTGSTTNNYTLPAGGITASTQTATGSSPVCVITGNLTASASLTCSTIPTTSGTVGTQNVLVTIATGTPTDKGDVILQLDGIITIPPFVPTTIDQPNIGLCPTQTVTIGTAYNCVFPLTGSPNNEYVLPAGGITASTQTATGSSPACVITGNLTASASLVCNSIPTIGGTVGTQNVLVRIATGTPTDKGDVILRASVLPRTGGVETLIAVLIVVSVVGGSLYYFTIKNKLNDNLAESQAKLK